MSSVGFKNTRRYSQISILPSKSSVSLLGIYIRIKITLRSIFDILFVIYISIDILNLPLENLILAESSFFEKLMTNSRLWLGGYI
jgi:hypothetical protein